jgi:hypothetical protein
MENPGKNEVRITISLRSMKQNFCHRLPPIVAVAPTLKEKVCIGLTIKYLLFVAYDIPSVEPPNMTPQFDD